MEQNLLGQHIVSKEVLDAQLKALVELDPVLVPVLDQVGQVPLRRGKSGFGGLASIVLSQLLSAASARAIYERLEALVGEMSTENFLAVNPEKLRDVGLSRAKIDCLRSVARADMSGEMDFEALHHMGVNEAMEKLTQLKGIGTWSAEIYLLSSIAHPDIFPAGDLVLQKMLGKIFEKNEKPNEKQARELARKWTPYRGAAARLLWRYFTVSRDREGTNP